MIKGQPVSPGLAIGPALLIIEENFTIPPYLSTFELEEARLGQAIGRYRTELYAFWEKARLALGKEIDPIYEAYIQILQNIELHKKILTKIKRESINAESALAALSQEEMSAEIRNVLARLIATLLKRPQNPLENLAGPCILISREFTPRLVAAIDKKKVLGLIIENEEISALARKTTCAMKIPAIFGLHQITTTVKTGDIVAVNGLTGEAAINPSEEALKLFST